jgi:hypothetical protein
MPQIRDRPHVRRRTVLGTILAAVLLVPLVAEYASADESYTFPPEDDSTATRVLAFAAVRIFGSEAGGEQKGSGFVIDGDQGLILSAAHVVSGLNGMAWIAFPRDDDRHPAKILIPKRGGSLVPDLSVLQLDPVLNGLHAMEVQFDAIHEEEEHRITGFGRANSEPVHGKAQPSKTNECTYTLRNATLHGDSGSALLSPQGLVDGIAILGAESTGPGSMAEMKVLPLSCVRDLILNLVSDSQNDKIMNIVWTAGDREFRDAFQPPPGAGSKWVSNLRLSKAMLGWIASGTRQLSADKKHSDDALRIIFERRLGLAMARDVARAEAATVLSVTIPQLQNTIIPQLQNTIESVRASCSGGPHGLPPSNWGALQVHGNTAVNAFSDASTALATGQTSVAEQLISSGLSELDALVDGLHQKCVDGTQAVDPASYGAYVAFRNNLKMQLQTPLRFL